MEDRVFTRHAGRVRDHPLARVGRHVWGSLEYTTDRRGEGRGEVRVRGFVRRQLLRSRGNSTDDAGDLTSAPVDEARLADRHREETPEVVEGLVGALNGVSATVDLAPVVPGAA